jgi:hypothetical protein
MDEVGTALGIYTNSMVLEDLKKKRIYVKSPQDREWVSMIETVSALGRTTRPVIIFKGKNLQRPGFTTIRCLTGDIRLLRMVRRRFESLSHDLPTSFY